MSERAPKHAATPRHGADAESAGAAETFEALRPLLFTVAYELLGSVHDADDVLQESFLRWAQVDRARVQSARAYLTKVVSRQALNHLRARRRRREQYTGEWLPEPVATDAEDLADDMILAESVALATLVVLESLGPVPRTVFVLREVFGLRFDEIAAIVDRDGATVRKIAERARTQVAARRKSRSGNLAATDAVISRLGEAISAGDMDDVIALLADDATFISDGGGKVPSVPRAITDRRTIARLLMTLTRRTPSAPPEFGCHNGSRSVLVRGSDGHMSLVCVDSFDGKVQSIYVHRNPDKLQHVERPVVLDR